MKKYIFLIISLLAVQQAWAQASLEVTLTDVAYTPISGRILTVVNKDIGFSVEKATNSQGKVRLSGLSTSGMYIVKSEDDETYYAQELPGISLISGKTTSLQMVLVPKTQELDEVTISAMTQPATINSVDAEVASEMSSEEIAMLPVEGRDITRALYRLPNITQATGFFPEAPNVAINGANALYTNYQIDGMDNNENFLGGQRFAMPIGFTQNITALTNNFSAEEGLTSNGVINITTKSGTNETKGEAFFINRPGPVLDASSPYAQRDLSGNQVKDGFQRYQFGVGMGGALAKDQTFYYVNIEHTTDLKDNLLNIPQLGINETVRGQNNFTYLSAKIDQRWSNNFRSSLRVNAGLVNIERQGGGLEGGSTFPSAGNRQDRNSLNIAFKNIYQTSNLTYESNYLYGSFRWNYANPNNEDSPNVTVLDPNGQTLGVLGHPGYVFDERESMHLIQQKLTLYKGNHTLKAGGQLKSSGFELFGGGNPNGSYTVQLSDSELSRLQQANTGSGLTPDAIPSSVNVLYYGVELHPTSFQKTQQLLSFYIEDQISVNAKLNVTLGLRYDYDNLSQGGGGRGDFNNIAPRLSMNYQVSNRTSLRAGYGIYYDKILYAIYSDALQFNTNSADYQTQIQKLIDLGALPADTDVNAVTNDGNFTASADGVTYLQGPSAASLQGERQGAFANELRILNPNGYQNPYSHQIMLGLQHKLSENSLFYVDLMHNRSYNLFRIRNLNAPAPYPINPENVVVRSGEEADRTRPIPIQSDGQGNYAEIDGAIVRGVARNVIMTESAGRSNYYAANFTLQQSRQEGSNYSYRFIYTLSLLENNTEDINFRAMDSNNYEAEWGPSINDRTHAVNAIVNYYPVDNLTITLASLIQSGQPINRVPDASVYGTTDLNGDGRAFGDAYVGNSDRAPGESRNSDRLPWSNTFDLSAYYQIPVGMNKIELGAQVFNILNAENLSGYSNNATQSNQIQPGPRSSGVLIRRNAAPPRQFQFSLRYLF